jgi:hypothetical protein
MLGAKFMINAKKLSGAAVAAAAAALFISGCASMSQPSDAQTAKVHCFGVNSCKGQSDCKSAYNSCKGLNACKGKGFVAMTKPECDAAGGRAG